MSSLNQVALSLSATSFLACCSIAVGADRGSFAEAYRDVPMPEAFRVEASQEGPVFADTSGMTLYKWPQHKLRNGYSGESPGSPALTRTARLPCFRRFERATLP